ncbi:hypothetical protein HaLaN_19188 [Haematococcus lacustris]|uniref:Uncharacterized protein n=1 Tax=Haematococcus lacustris TaxID=44745 RepID=A0A699ZU48_HAELA|nr:hypothetical protein HaLaN_19188 [Haematococcus lacustris]
MTAQQGGAHTTVPQLATAAVAGPSRACLAPACSPGQGTPCPWLAASPALTTETAPVAGQRLQCSAQHAAHWGEQVASTGAVLLARPGSSASQG